MLSNSLYGMWASARRDNGYLGDNDERYRYGERYRITKEQEDFIYAIHNQNIEELRALIAKKTDGVNFTYNRYYVTDPNTNRAKEFTKYHTITNPLAQAIEWGSVEAIQLLLEANANPNDSALQYSVLHKAARQGNLQIIKLLIKYGAQENSRGGSSLYCALKNDHAEVAQLLITHDADKEYALQKACDNFDRDRNLNADICRWLLRHGADIHKKMARKLNVTVYDLHCNTHDGRVLVNPELKLILLQEDTWKGWLYARAKELAQCCSTNKKQSRKINKC